MNALEGIRVLDHGSLKALNPRRVCCSVTGFGQNGLKPVSSPIKLSATPVRTELPPPLWGQHTEAVLRELLGYGAAQLAAPRQDGVV